mmetsp:Transcript_1247/g.2854  ORF Transcript_1247/g.2854 Transcript_1247/m.2854 type:complete len:327 (-) Transcript_1247:138-1118(-)
MIFAISPEQAQQFSQEFAQVFEEAQVAHALDANWWMNNELRFPKDAQQGNTETKEHPNEKNASESTAATADAKPAAKELPENAKAACRPNNCCPGMNRTATFRPCRRYNQAARCQRQANNPRFIEQRTPIHMQPETPDAAKMSLDVTGFSPEEISIHIDEFVVSIKGQRTNKLGDVFCLDRRFRLDKNTANVDQVTATFDDGILELTVPKKSVAGPRKIPIVVSGFNAETETEPTASDNNNEEEEASSHEEENVVADSNEVDEEPQSTEETVPNEESEEEQDEIVVETVNEDNVATNEDEVQESPTNDIVANKSAEEEETWEEVSN